MTTAGNKTQTQGDISDKILEKVSAFPNMPKAGMELRSLLGQEDVSIDEIEKILR
jgi:HD-like signal output (HDOD) protein